ncbi:MAG: hypothetical protein CME85_05290 [Henriciella sp.]|jgi:uncharacterized protein YecT (DUF1311 family)|uniref:lysozyme inhibitor LprI family protein n=1 Tax=Henriciella sp. TaxID=1968823 RepID=UPI000C0CD326|nr:lysozyme inhibitor LprI family protein [Henriciella sp.]MAN72543.1 hypothetical protein [Henriciella sp.]MBK74895.1 hypothetical protein [Henriciella sp.]PHR79456.1 MAG: hypothetical protein COA64_06275 [Henriciella sp.]|tara:strand:- start:1360 stop:1887 length:528 start_codon:yes stop_codon:yes gene_type:complete
MKQAIGACLALSVFAISAPAGTAQSPDGDGELAGAAGEAALKACLAAAGADSGARHDCIGTMVDACPGNAGSTLSMVSCVSEETGFWDTRLNAVYRDLMAAYRQQDEDFADGYDLTARLSEVQRGWIEWRDVKCKFAYDEFRGGTLGRITGADCMLQMTAERVIELETLLETARL